MNPCTGGRLEREPFEREHLVAHVEDTCLRKLHEARRSDRELEYGGEHIVGG